MRQLKLVVRGTSVYTNSLQSFTAAAFLAKNAVCCEFLIQMYANSIFSFFLFYASVH